MYTYIYIYKKLARILREMNSPLKNITFFRKVYSCYKKKLQMKYEETFRNLEKKICKNIILKFLMNRLTNSRDTSTCSK